MNVVDLAIKSVIVALVGIAVFSTLRKASAATRHFALALTLFSLCALPFVAPLLPTWQVPFLKVRTPAPQAKPTTTEAHVQPVPTSTPLAVPAQIDRESAVLIVWASIATLLGLRVVTRLSRLRNLERSLPMSSQPELQAIVAEYCRRHRRHFLLLEGEANEPPMTWGHTRPVLLLPSAAKEWSEDRLRSVLLHELAHVERGDWIVSLASEIVCALFWFNPLAWVIRKRLELESESAADDRVLSMGVPKTQYATHLVELLRDLNRFPKAADAAVAMARPGRLDSRVKAILEDRRSRRTVHGGATIGLVALVSGVVVIVGAAGPTIVHETDKVSHAVFNATNTNVTEEQGSSSNPAEASDLMEAARSSSDSMNSVNWADPSVHPAVTPPTSSLSRPAPLAKPTPARGSSSVISSRDGHHSASVTSGIGTELAVNALVSAESVHKIPTLGRLQPDSNDPDLAAEAKDINRELKEANADIKKAVIEANAEMAKEGIHMDISGLISGAIQSANVGLQQAKLSRATAKTIAAKTLEEVSKGLKSLPPSETKNKKH